MGTLFKQLSQMLTDIAWILCWALNFLKKFLKSLLNKVSPKMRHFLQCFHKNPSLFQAFPFFTSSVYSFGQPLKKIWDSGLWGWFS